MQGGVVLYLRERTSGLPLMPPTSTDSKDEVSLRQYAELLLRYATRQKGLFFIAAVLLMGNIGLQLANPQILRYFIDEATQGSPLNRLLAAAGLFIIIALVQQIVSVLATYASGKVGWMATNALRSDLAGHALHLDMSFHNEHTPGEMIERIDGDANQLGQFFSSLVVHVLESVLLLVGILVLLFREDWRAGLALTVFSGVVLVILSSMRNLAVGRYRRTQEAVANAFGFIEERVAGREDVRTNAAQSYTMRGFHWHIRNWFQKYLATMVMFTLSFSITRFSFAMGAVVGLGVGVYLFLNDLATIGTVYLILHYTYMAAEPIQRFTWQLNELQRAAGSIVRITELSNTRSKVVDGPGVRFSRGALGVRFDGVTFAYNPEETVLRNVSFDLRPRRVLGLIGRTGSGKTTISRLLFRLYDPSSGRITLDGEDIRGARLRESRERIALVTQDVRLFRGTVRDNLTFYDTTMPDERLLEVIHDLELGPWLRKLPDGLDTELQADGAGLSAGEAQLLAFARAFLKDPGLVILDEATSRLDRGTEQLIERTVDNLVEGRTAIIIAHHLPTLARCDELLMLDNGRVVEHGDRLDLANDPSSRFHSLLQTGLEEILT